MVSIVIGGKPGAGSSTAARLLAKRLGLRHFSAGDYFKKFGKGRETEKASSFWRTKRGSSSEFHNALDMAVRAELKKGNVVVDGKLAIRVNKGNYDFSVWLDVTKKERARRCAKRDGISEKEAVKIISERENHERSNWKRIYGFDFFKQKNEADLAINATNKKPEDVVDIIIKELRARGLME